MQSGPGAPTLGGMSKVSIGMPVYNGAKTIGTAISAVLGQTFDDFEFIISDNASTDDTLPICEAAASHDPRIRIIRQAHNRGPIANFEAVLAAATGPFFMFAAVDDRVEPQFIEETLAAIVGAPDAVACAPRTLIHFTDGRTREARGSRPIELPGWLRPARFLLRPADNSRFYGLYRTAVMRAAFLGEEKFHAFDWAVSALTLTQGTHLQSRSILLHRQGAEPGKYNAEHGRSASGWLHRLLPLAGMSAALLPRLTPVQCVFAVPSLLVLNARQSVEFLLAYALGIPHR